MSVDEARGAWRTAGRTVRWLLVWPRRRLLRLLQHLFEEIERLHAAHDDLRAERDRAVADRDRARAERDEQLRDRDARIASLERRLGRHQKDSTTSSKPPSTDGPAARHRTHPVRPPSGRRPGGQRGHAGHARPLVPVEQVTRVVPVLPDRCPGCHHVFTDPEKQTALATDVHRHQVVDLPVVTTDITEYQCAAVRCRCGRVTRLPLPREALSGFGPRLVALVAHLTVGARTPRRTIEQVLGEVLGIRIALGSTQRLIEEVSQALQQPCDALRQQLRHEPVLHADETGWWQSGVRRWLWVARTFACFVVATSRSAQILEEVLGPVFAGILCTDRYSAYIKYHHGTAQFCWAHLKRDLLGLATLSKGPAADRFARDALTLHLRLFRLWHRFRGGAFDRAHLIARAISIEQRFFTLGEAHLDSADRDVRALARVFYWQVPQLFAFLDHEGVEPTNNGAERTIRRAVQWRKICFGNRSEAGAIATGRLLTVAATCARQHRNLFEYLTEAIRCHRRGLPVPSLLPTEA